MNSKLTAAFLSAIVFLGGLSVRAQDRTAESFRHALDLYEHGMFERAGAIFGQIASSKGDLLAEGYKTLCSVRLQEQGYPAQVENYIKSYPYSRLIPQIRFYNGLNLFDREDYKGAAMEFSLIEAKLLEKDQVAEYMFKNGYSTFEIGDLDRAWNIFANCEKMPYSDYTAPSRYSMGYIDYTRKDFQEAYNWFEKAGKDARFTDISNYYMTECRFMQKDYAYVLKNGVKLYDEVPADRQSHLARIISESYLATGDSGKAKEFYDKIEQSRVDMDRDDWFYAGTVLYSTGDFKGAIENFSRMSSRTDSIGQIANYQLGYSYIQTGDKVAALESFQDASSRSFNPDIQEDAHFNYAKLSFDLNNNPKVFDDYMAKYPAKEKGDQIYSYMALASLYNHDYAGAVDAYANIDNLDDNQKSNYMRANYLRANQLIENGSWSDAVPLLKAAGYYAPKHDPFNQLTRYWLGESYYRSDQFDKAVETFQDLYNNSALDGKPEGKLIPYDLAYSYFRKGDYDSAAKWFDEYLQQEKNPAEGEDAASRRADCDFIKKDYKTAVQGYESAMRRF
ncbi:MAG: tetratricopeptide repeat protein, partial [Bacteroidales bacterium]|nr:tetratricopeptide repeat protein [Bacteroidales bacterium]